ncbi:MAG TPA: hypothetical protein VN285_01995 [Candidatus Deferrimicrobium sp.]|nr:hypothetical protein [Candidatus Deferrimicrobium sp.]
MKTNSQNHSFAVFPYLKTTDAVTVGQLTFRSTDVSNELTSKQKEHLSDIASMLFLKDNLRIKSASYALIPFIDVSHPGPFIEHLKHVQSVVAYCYASPRHEFGDIFLSPEHASMVVFSPERVIKGLVRPDFHVEEVPSITSQVADNRTEIDGYAGLFNFRHHFWVAKGSRLYGPKPHLTLNISQHLSSDIVCAEQSRCDYRLLCEFLRKPVTKTSARAFTALRWFNAANSDANDPSAAIVDLSIAFEALMNLPADQKADRLTDAVSMLLGRIPRVDIWVRQFYDARSQIVHQGSSQLLHFVATDSIKKRDGQQYQSLLSYGRQIFQLCLGTLLTGADLAEKSGLEEKLITNEERFREICRILDNNQIQLSERLDEILPIIAAIDQYRYISESSLQLETMIGATRRAAKALLEIIDENSTELKRRLSALITAKRTTNHFEELDELRKLDSAFKEKTLLTANPYRETVQRLIEIVWYYVFNHYFWLKEHLLPRAQGKTLKDKGYE